MDDKTIELQIMQLLREYLEEDSEAFQVALYCLHNVAVNRAASAALHNPSMTEVPVPPESLLLLQEYSSGVVNNAFYHRNFAAINAAIIMEGIRSHSLSKHLLLVAQKDDPNSKGIVRELQAQRFEVLTLVVLYDKGHEKAKQFDFFLRKAVSLSPVEIRYFKKHGVT